jgi:hypothetical protein
MLNATATIALISTVRRIKSRPLRWVSLMAVSECPRGGDRRNVIEE